MVAYKPSQHVCICWYACYYASMHSHYVRERCTAAVCSTSNLNKVDITTANSKQHVNMPPARAQEHKWRKAHTYQNTTHGAASWIIRGIWHRLSIIHYLLFCCWCPMRLRNVCWLPTCHSPHIKSDNQTRYSKDTCTLYTDLHDGVWPLGTKHEACQITSDNIR